jgi:hypothetical protein
MFFDALQNKKLIIDNLKGLCYYLFILLEPLAQSVEQLPFKQWAVGSSPTRLTRKEIYNRVFLFLETKNGGIKKVPREVAPKSNGPREKSLSY